MSVEIVSAGPMLSVQDAGRIGMRHLGVSTAGPIDAANMALANALCGNAAGAAALEFAGPAGSFRTKRPIRFSVACAGCDIRIDGRLVSVNESHRLRPGETLIVGVPQGTVWGYIAFSGGIAIPATLGSRSTHLRSGLGGVDGRALRAGDVLPLGEDDEDAPCLRPETASRGIVRRDGPVRVVLGPQNDYFAPEIVKRLSEEEFTITPQRDRMAMVLGGVELPAQRGHDIVSDGTVPGSIQVPGSGLPLILLAESQTTGGYPKIATVISTDLARLAQMPVGAKTRFSIVTRDEGEEILLADRRNMRAVLAGLVAKPEGLLRSEYLLSCDLVGGIFAPEEIVQLTASQDGGDLQVSGSQNLAREAHKRIIGMIFEGVLKSGDALQEAALGEALGMSRTPVREAIKRIESEGLAVPEGRFIRVRSLPLAEVEEIFFLRLELEPFAARSAVRLPPAQIDAMEARVRALMAIDPAIDDVQWRTDNDFHNMLAQETGNRTLISTIEALHRRTCVFDHSQVPNRFLKGANEHLVILDAIRTGDAQAVEQALTVHLENARDAVLQRMRELPDRSEQEQGLQ
jgi:biotin-dependent carboxylase-like uncharacterized protein